MTQLSQNFSLGEMTTTSTGKDNRPTPQHLTNLTNTAQAMQAVRVAGQQGYQGQLGLSQRGGQSRRGWLGDERALSGLCCGLRMPRVRDANGHM